MDDIGCTIQTAVTGTGNYIGNKDVAIIETPKAEQTAQTGDGYIISYIAGTILTGVCFESSPADGDTTTAIVGGGISDLWGWTLYISAKWNPTPTTAPIRWELSCPGAWTNRMSLPLTGTCDGHDYHHQHPGWISVYSRRQRGPVRELAGLGHRQQRRHTFSGLEAGKDYYLHVCVLASNNVSDSLVQTVEIQIVAGCGHLLVSAAAASPELSPAPMDRPIRDGSFCPPLARGNQCL